MLIKIAHREHAGDHRILLRFNDGSAGIHDFANMVSGSGALLTPLRDPIYFARSFLECGALTWPNGFDIAPDWLRREMIAAEELAVAA